MGVWPEVKKMKGKIGKWHAVWMVVMIMMILLTYFFDKYMKLYNSVPYDASEMKSFGAFVLSGIFNSSCSDYIITVTDVMNAIAHLKSGKSDG